MKNLEGLRNKLALSAMTSVNDGLYCKQVGQGAALVTLGGVNADKECENCEIDGFPRHGETFEDFVRNEVAVAKESGAAVSMGIRAASPESFIRAGNILKEAGADFMEVDAHCNNKCYHALGIGHWLVRNPDKLVDLIKKIKLGTDIPIIVKCATHVMKDYGKFAQRMIDAGAAAVYYDIRFIKFPLYYIHRPDFNIIKDVKKNSNAFLIVAGTVRNMRKVRRMFASGADCVAIAGGTLKNRGLIKNLSRNL